MCSSGDEDDVFSNSTPAVAAAVPLRHGSIFAKFTELTRQFASLVEQNQKLDLMSRKSASIFLNFDSPKRRRAAQYTPKHRVLESIPETQEDDDFEF